jgi:hypothetical protein
LACSAAATDRWQHFEAHVPSRVYLDTLTAGEGPWQQRRVWIRREHPPGSMGEIASDKVLYVFNCERQTFTVKSAIYYRLPGGDGYPLSSLLLRDEQLQFTDVVPGTVSEALQAIACVRR